MQSSTFNNVKIYTISNSKKSSIPEWMSSRKKKALRNDPNWQKRVELLQDFEFPEASLRLKQSPDGEYIVATGVYKPQIRVFELSQMSMKFTRHTDCENVQFEILSPDWRKTVLLQADRSVEFHGPNGMHYRTRIPKFGRDMKYHWPSCDLLLTAAGCEVYRLNLNQGQFLNSIQTESPGVNVCAINPAHQMWGFGGEDGFLEFWDHRERRRLARCNIGAHLQENYGSMSSPEITALEFFPDGLTYGAGLSTGQLFLFDVRFSGKSLVSKDHQYDSPIKKIEYHSSTGNIVTADTKSIRIWNKNDGKLFTSIEPDTDINDVLTFPDSGLIATTNEGPGMGLYYIPSLGPAPKWCSFLDSLTEELEETVKQQTYDDYRFVTLKELSTLGLEHLIGTNLLKAYMHGFFIDLRLYEKARAIANPFAFEEYKERLVKEKLQKETESRISTINKLPKVNRATASRLLLGKPSKKGRNAEQQEDESKSIPTTNNPLGDGRFGDMFKNPDFQIDENDPEYIKFHTKSKQRSDKNMDESVSSTGPDTDGSQASSNEFSDSDASDELLPKKVRHVRKTKKEDGLRLRLEPKLYEVNSNEIIGGRTADLLRRRDDASFAERMKIVSNKSASIKDKEKIVFGAQSMTYAVQPKRGQRTSQYKRRRAA